MPDSLCSLLSLLKWPRLYAHGFICARYDTTLLWSPLWTTCPKNKAIQKKFLCLRPGLELQDCNLISNFTGVLHRHLIYHSKWMTSPLGEFNQYFFCFRHSGCTLCDTKSKNFVIMINRSPEKSHAQRMRLSWPFPLSCACKVVTVTTLSALIDSVYCCLDFCTCYNIIPHQRESKKPGPTIFKTSMRKV